MGFVGVYPFFLFLIQNSKAVLACTQNQCFEQNKENIKINLVKFSFFTAEINLCILHGQVFVMVLSYLSLSPVFKTVTSAVSHAMIT